MIATLSGCALFRKKEPTAQLKVYPEDSLLVDCVIPQPPHPTLYMQYNLSDREKVMTMYSGSLIDSLVDCNIQKAKMRELKMKGQ